MAFVLHVWNYLESHSVREASLATPPGSMTTTGQ